MLVSKNTTNGEQMPPILDAMEHTPFFLPLHFKFINLFINSSDLFRPITLGETFQFIKSMKRNAGWFPELDKFLD